MGGAILAGTRCELCLYTPEPLTIPEPSCSMKENAMQVKPKVILARFFQEQGLINHYKCQTLSFSPDLVITLLVTWEI